MIVFELSGPKLVPIPNFSSISLQMADFSLFCEAKSCEVPSGLRGGGHFDPPQVFSG